MDKYIYDEKNGLWYELQGDYYLPCLKLPKEESRHIGIWGQRHLRYLKQHRYGGCFKRFDLRITNNRKGCCQATAAFLFREVITKS